MKIGVLDSFSSFEKDFFKNKNIKVIKLTNDSSNPQKYNHGELVCSVIFRENENCEIILVSVFDKNMNCSKTLLTQGMKYLINLNVDIINLSLGTEENSEKLTDIEDLCKKATERGILIVAAHSNNNRKSYPASYKNILGVKNRSNPSLEDNLFTIDKCNNDIIFNCNKVSVMPLGYMNLMNGNSFLCALVSGVLSKFLEEKNLPKTLNSCMSIFENLKDNYNSKLFLFSQYKWNEPNCCYLSNTISDDYQNLFIKKVLNNKFLIKLDEKTSIEDIYNILPRIDLITIGVNSYDYYIQHKDLIIKLINLVASNHKNILIRYPLLSWFDRYTYCNLYNININCLYI